MIEQPSVLQIVVRIRAILGAIFFAAIGHGSLIVLLPIDMTSKGVSVSTIGIVMACFSIGILIGSKYSYPLIQLVGHHRAYAAMAAIMCITAIVHTLTENTLVLAFLRVAAGVCMAVIYITLESWLSAISDRNSRGLIYSFYQVCVGLGFLAAPFVATWFPTGNYRSFSLVAMMMSLSLLPLLFSRQQAPVLEGDQKVLSIIEMLRDSPTSSAGALCHGIVFGSVSTLFTVYLLNTKVAGNLLALIYGGLQIGALVFQVPVGKLADKISKRDLMLVICMLIVASSIGIISLTAVIENPHLWLLLPVIVLGGAQACLYPLSVTLLFEQIDADKAIPALGALLILQTTGVSIGPIIASTLMEEFGNNAMPTFVLVSATTFAMFVYYRKQRSKRKVDTESIPYVISLQTLRSTVANLDPRLDNVVFVMNSRGLRALANSIAIMPHRSFKLMRANKGLLESNPNDALESLVLLKPRRSYEIVAAMVKLFPEKRLEFVDALGDIIILEKQLINRLLIDGLCYKADQQTCDDIAQRFEAILNPQAAMEDGDEQPTQHNKDTLVTSTKEQPSTQP